MKEINSKQHGFIAVISSIIISALLLALITTTSVTGFFSRYAILDSEFKERSSSLAEACVDVALLKISNDSSYSGNETFPVNTQLCSIRPIYSSGSQIIIETQGIFENSYSNMRVKVDSTTLSVISWEEVPHF